MHKELSPEIWPIYNKYLGKSATETLITRNLLYKLLKLTFIYRLLNTARQSCMSGLYLQRTLVAKHLLLWQILVISCDV